MISKLINNITLKLYIHRYAFAFIVMLVVTAQSFPLLGQENTNGSDVENKVVSPDSLSPETASPISSRIKQDIIYLPDSEGHLQPVPLGTSLKSYLDWLEQSDPFKKSEQPAAIIQNLVCRGNIQYSANRAPWAFLTCQLEIDVQNSPQWQFQLLDMKEATLSGMTENGKQPQPEDLLISREDQNNQLILWYRNRNKINVTVNLMVPIRLTGEQSQLTLSVPAASRTELQLQTDIKDIEFHLKSNGFEEVEQNDQGDQITIKGFNQLIDFSWAPYREESDMSPVFNVDTQIELKRASGSSTITARQVFTMEQGKLSSIVIQIPSSFAIDEVLMADTPIPHSIGTDRSLVTLNFQQPIETNAQIDWTLSAPIRKFESELILNGFVVKEAKTQTGKIGILKSNDWRIGQNPADSKNIYQMSVRDLNREGEYSQAFRYYGQPWQLALATQRVQSQYTLKTFYDLQAKKDSLELRVDFEITPRNRTLDAVLLQWPDLDSGLWTIEKVVQNSTGQEIKWGFDKNNSRSQLLELSNWDKTDFIHLVASRAIPDETAGLLANKVKLPITLPQISTTNSRHGPQNLRITSAPGPYQLIIEGQGIEEVAPENVSPSLSTRTLYSDQPEHHAHQNWYAITNPQHKMNINVVKIERTVQCKSNFQILRIDSAHKKISYQQVFNFNISNLPLNQIVLRRQRTHSDDQTIVEQQSAASVLIIEDQYGNRLQVKHSVETPHSIPGVTPDQSSDLSAAPLTTKLDDKQLTDDFFTVTLEQPVLGEYTLIVKGEIPIDKLSDAGLFKATPPLLIPTQTNLLQLELSNQSAYQITPTNQSWEPQLPEEPNTNIPHWQDTSSSQSLDFQININESRLAAHVGFAEGHINTWFRRDGIAISELSFQLAHMPPVFLLEHSEDYVLDSAYWSEDQADKFLLNPEREMSNLAFHLPERAVGKPGRLVVTIQHQNQQISSFRKQNLAVPKHSLDQYIAWVHWKVHLPNGVYLFSPPRNLSPGYSWNWKDWGFRRVDTSQDNLSAQGLTAIGLKSVANSYSFTSVGWPKQMSIRCMGRGLLMVIGTGIPLLIAVFFSGRRRDDKLRAGLLLFAIIGGAIVLFPEQLALLAQPAIIGTFFTFLATGIAMKLQSNHEDQTLIIIGASQNPNIETPPDPNVALHSQGADEVTRVQPPPAASVESTH